MTASFLDWDSSIKCLRHSPATLGTRTATVPIASIAPVEKATSVSLTYTTSSASTVRTFFSLAKATRIRSLARLLATGSLKRTKKDERCSARRSGRWSATSAQSSSATACTSAGAQLSSRSSGRTILWSRSGVERA